MDLKYSHESTSSVKFYCADDEDPNNNNDEDLFELLFIKILEVISSELINDLIENAFSSDNDEVKENGSYSRRSAINSEIQRVLSTDWINKYQVSFFFFDQLMKFNFFFFFFYDQFI